MKEDLFEVLMYLFENHIGREHPEKASQETLFHELAEAGFTPEVIDMAFEWLDGVAALHIAESQSEDKLGLSSGFRVYSREEIDHFGYDVAGLLMKFEQLGILDAYSREIVINRLFASVKTRGIDCTPDQPAVCCCSDERASRSQPINMRRFWSSSVVKGA